MTKMFIDRIEDSIAVLYDAQGQNRAQIPVELFPQEAGEGTFWFLSLSPDTASAKMTAQEITEIKRRIDPA